MKTLLRRAAATGVPMGSLVKLLFTFATTDRLENVHPLQGGILRLKHPRSAGPACRARAPGFSGRASCGRRSASTRSAGAIGDAPAVWKIAIARDPHARAYTDLALTPVRDDDDMTLDLLTKTTGARAAVAHVKKGRADVFGSLA